MRGIRAIAGVELRRFARDKSNIFFVLIFPLLLVLVLGLQFEGEGTSRVALSGESGPLHDELSAALNEADVEITEVGQDAMQEQVARGRVEAGIYIPSEADEAFATGDEVQIEMIVGSQPGSQIVSQQVATATGEISLEQNQISALLDAGASEGDAQEALSTAEMDPVTISVSNVGGLAEEFAGLGQYDATSASMMLLFVFLMSLAGSATLIGSRKYGIQSRVASTPTSGLSALGGQALGRWTIATFQGVYIIVATSLLFDVDWGNLGLVIVILFVFSAVAAGGAMILGSVFDNDGAASGAGVGLGLVLGALGGCMMPLELFPDTLYTIAHFTPHGWGYQAFAEVQRHGGSLLDIAPHLGVLAAMAIALLWIGTWTLRRSLARAL